MRRVRAFFFLLFCVVLTACNQNTSAVIIEDVPNSNEHYMVLCGNEFQTISDCVWADFNIGKSERVFLGNAKKTLSFRKKEYSLYRYGSDYVIKAEPNAMDIGMVKATYTFYKCGVDYSFDMDKIESVLIGKYEWDPILYELKFVIVDEREIKSRDAIRTCFHLVQSKIEEAISYEPDDLRLCIIFKHNSMDNLMDRFDIIDIEGTLWIETIDGGFNTVSEEIMALLNNAIQEDIA